MIASEMRMVALVARGDIFEVDRDRRVYILLILASILGILSGLLMMTMEKVEVPPEYFENMPTISAKIVMTLPPEKLEEKKKEEKKEDKETLKQKVLRLGKSIGAGGGAGGGTGTGSGNQGFGSGDIKERVSQKGLLAIISGKAHGGAVVTGGSFMSNSSVRDLDAVLNNIGGLKTSGKAGVGRMGLSGSNFNMGYGSGGGFGHGGAGGIDGLLGSLGGGGAQRVAGLTKRASVDLPSSKDIFSAGDNMAGRSPEEIYRVVMQHIGGLRSEYNKRLRANPMLKGKVTVRFAIEPSGRVAWCNVVGSTIKDKVLELAVTSRVKTWQFEACGRCGVATVTYPFAFSQ